MLCFYIVGVIAFAKVCSNSQERSKSSGEGSETIDRLLDADGNIANPLGRRACTYLYS